MVVVSTVTVRLAALLAIAEMDIETPVGAPVLAVPEEFVYHTMLPAVPSARPVVVRAKLALPATPTVIMPDWAATVTAGAGELEAEAAGVVAVAVAGAVGFLQQKTVASAKATSELRTASRLNLAGC
jgi:hypothetical protein